MRSTWIALTAVGGILLAAGCSSGPRPPQPGSPAFFWAAAKSTYAAGDFIKSAENLSQLAKGDSEFAVQAQPLSIVVSAGIAQAYDDLADNFEIGGRANRANPTPYVRRASMYHKQAAAMALDCAESVQKFAAREKSETILFDLGYPTGTAAEPVQLQRVAKGMTVSDPDVEGLEHEMIRRGVLRSVARAVGAGDDVAKALDVFKAGPVKIARPVFMAAMARMLVDQADLFSSKKLDQPQRLRVLCDQAEKALQEAAAGPESKVLQARIAKMRKAAKT